MPRTVTFHVVLRDEEVELIARDVRSDPNEISAGALEAWLYDVILRELESRSAATEDTTRE